VAIPWRLNQFKYARAEKSWYLDIKAERLYRLLLPIGSLYLHWIAATWTKLNPLFGAILGFKQFPIRSHYIHIALATK
jgi:hypothetical protein